MNADQFIELVEEILEVEKGIISMESSLDDVDWDSLANISFIAEVDQRANVRLDPQRLADAEIVRDLFSLVQEAVGATK